MDVNVGDRFMLEVGEVFYDNKGNVLYRMKGFNSLVFDEEGLRRLTPMKPIKSFFDSPVQIPLPKNVLPPKKDIPPKEGMIEKYIDLAVNLKRDINITMEQDGRVEMSLTIPSSYHTVTESKPKQEPDTCELCRWYDVPDKDAPCINCMHDHISFFEMKERKDG